MSVAKSWSNAAFKARALLDQGSIASAPPWLEAIERFGAHEPKMGRTPKQIHFPEDSLYQAYIHKNPQFRQQALDLNSENPSAIKLFVLAQAALIEKGHSQKEAYRIVESEFSKAMSGSKLGAGLTALASAQRQEETLLQDALKARRAQFGPPANLESAVPVGQPFSFRQPPRGAPQSMLPQSGQASPLGFQPSTKVDMTQATAARTPSDTASPAGSKGAKKLQQHQQSPGSSGSNANSPSQESQRGIGRT